MKFENTEIWGFKHAVRGMRNPMESWDKSDSGSCPSYGCNRCKYKNGGFCRRSDSFTDFIMGDADLALAQRLIKAGSEHRKFMRQIFVSTDITAPLYWWKEFDTYKVGTVSDSYSTMHKLASTPITIECFETGDSVDNEVHGLIYYLEELRLKYLKTKEMRCWKELIRWLPESWLQKRTVTMSYENVLNMYRQRKNHKLTEWSVDFVRWVESLSYVKELLEVE